MANSVDPDETARYEPSYQDLHCLHRYLRWSARLNSQTTIKRMEHTLFLLFGTCILV